jgi:hypothetical protein
VTFPLPVETPPLQRAEEMLAKGNLPAARSILSPLAAKNEPNARLYLLLGHLDFAEGDTTDAVAAYKKALELEGSSAKDPIMRSNAKLIVERGKDDKNGLIMIDALVLNADASAAPLLADLAESAPTNRMRSHAFQGLERLGETKRLNLVNYFGNELERVKESGCKVRKWYVDRLIALNDARALPVLKREHARRSGPFNLVSVNQCMQTALRNAIDRFEEKK